MLGYRVLRFRVLGLGFRGSKLQTLECESLANGLSPYKATSPKYGPGLGAPCLQSKEYPKP